MLESNCLISHKYKKDGQNHYNIVISLQLK